MYFMYLALMVVSFGLVLYISVFYSLGKFERTNTPDFVLATSVVVSLFFVCSADLIDTVSLVVYALIVLCARLVVLKRKFREPEMVLHLTILYLSLSRLDKVTGYGHPDGNLVVAQYMFLAAVIAGCICLIARRTILAVIASLLLVFPVSHFSLEILRNMVARRVTSDVGNMYVTKMYANAIYGLRFEREYQVDVFLLIDGKFQKTATETLIHGWGGSMDPQIPVVSSWEWNLVKKVFYKPAT